MGEEKLVVIPAGLYIELAVLKAIKSCLTRKLMDRRCRTGRNKSNGKSGPAHVTSLYIFQHRAYKRYIPLAIFRIVQ